MTAVMALLAPGVPVEGVRGLDRRSGRVWARVAPTRWPRQSFAVAALPKRKSQWRWNATRAVFNAQHAGALSVGAVNLFLTLISTYSDGHGKDITVKRSTIGEWIRRSTRTVRRQVTELEQAGFLLVEHRAQRLANGQVRQRANKYRFAIPTEYATGPTHAEDDTDLDLIRKGRVLPTSRPLPPPTPGAGSGPVVVPDEALDAWKAMSDTDRATRRTRAAQLAAEAHGQGRSREDVLELLITAGFVGPELIAAVSSLPRDRAGP